MRRNGSILVGVLWCLVLLATIVVSILHTARLDLTLAQHHGDAVQAHYLAVAGIEKAKALLALDARERRRSRKSYSAELENAPQHFREVSLGRGQFNVLNPGRAGGETTFGISDEEGRLNLNIASSNALAHLPAITSEVVAAILDWRDADNAVTPGGAETEYYAAQNPPTLPRNGPFQTERELLMVRGITPELLLGRRSNLEGRRGNGSSPSPGSRTTPARGSPTGDPRDIGWGPLLTVNSGIKNLNAAGQDRVNVQSADERALTGIQGITADMARAIIAQRGRTPFQSIADLLDVRPAAPAGTVGPNGVPINPGAAQNSGGATVISDDLFQQISDDVTTDDAQDLQGPINVNSAGIEVLLCLPGIERPLAQAIINYRQSTGFLPGIGALLKVPGMTRDIFKQILPLITARSETFRILAEGVVPGRETRRRIEVIVRVGTDDVTTLAYREDDL